MNVLRFVLLAAACSLPLAASAQWQWIDKTGQKVFSDQSPPPDIPAKNILKRPGGRALPAPVEEPAANVAAAAASAPKPAASGLKLSTKDKELEDKKKQAEAAEAEKKKAQEEKVAKAKADNCERAKRAKATFDSGVRVAQTNAKGEREFMSDENRASETKRLQGIIDNDCAKS